jgi:repressor of nif and glnA expression
MPPWVPWMSRVDEQILRVLDQVGFALPPKAIMLGIRERYGEGATPGANHVSRRVRGPLFEHGLIERPSPDEARTYYGITELGERYLHDSDAESEEFVTGIDDKSVE